MPPRVRRAIRFRCRPTAARRCRPISSPFSPRGIFMLDTKTIDTIAHAYDAAEKSRIRIRPPSAQYPGFTTEDAYAVQRRWVEIKVAAGNAIQGHKIGRT